MDAAALLVGCLGGRFAFEPPEVGHEGVEIDQADRLDLAPIAQADGADGRLRPVERRGQDQLVELAPGKASPRAETARLGETDELGMDRLEARRVPRGRCCIRCRRHPFNLTFGVLLCEDGERSFHALCVMPKILKNPHRISVLRSLTPFQKQKAFAVLVGISESMLQKIEIGERVLTPEQAQQITCATGINTNWLLGESDACTLTWGEPYDTGASISPEDLLDVRALIRRLTDPDDKIGRYVAGLLPKPAIRAISDYRKEESQPVRFSAKNVVALPEIARRLGDPEKTDTLGRYLRSQLSPKSEALLRQRLDGDVVKSLRLALARDLDRIIRSGSLYASGRISLENLSKKRQAELLGNPEGNDLARLNLKVLSEAFPGAIRIEPELAPLLTDLISGRAIYNQKHFAGIKLRPVTQRCLASKPKGEALTRLNRLLLVDCFPDLIEREHSTGFAKWQKLRTPNPSLQRGGGARSGDTPGRGAFASSFAFRLDLLLRASSEMESVVDTTIMHRLYQELHFIANEPELLQKIYQVLKEVGAKPGGCHPLHDSILDQDASKEWLFYGPAPSSEGNIAPQYAEMAKRHEQRLRNRFPHWTW